MPSPTSRADLNLFRVFDAIYSQGSLTRAAEVLHITQPAVSNALARLRAHMQDPLFVRSAGGMQPTPLARRWISSVRPALEQLDRCLQEQLDFDPQHAEQSFRIHASEQFEQNMMPALVAALAKRAPQVLLEITSGDRSAVPAAMARGDITLAIDAPLLNHPELLSQPLSTDHHVCVMRKGHPLAGRPLSLANYLAHRHIHASSRVRGAGHIDLALRALGKKRDIAVRLQHHASIPAILERTDYLSSVPAATAAQWNLHVCDLPFEAPQLVVQLFWHRTADADPALQWLRGLVLEFSD